MQRDIRYVAIEIGIGGYQPHPAADVFHFRYGDCKDKVTLLGSMLQVIGVKSYYVVAQTDRGIVQPDFPSPVAFDHMIIAIRLPDDVPSDGLWAIVEHPKYGRLLYFDPTDPYTPLGYIPSYEQRNYGLLVTPDGGELVPLPLSAPSTNRLLRTGQLKLTSTGDLTGDIQEVRWGGPAATERAWLLQTAPADRVKVIEEILGKQLANFRLTGATIGNLESYDQTLTLNYKFVAESYASDAGNLLLMRPRVLGNKRGIVDSDKPRKYPIEFPEATLQTDDFQITLPPGYVADDLPDAVDVKSEFASYKSKTEISGNSHALSEDVSGHGYSRSHRKASEPPQFLQSDCKRRTGNRCASQINTVAGEARHFDYCELLRGQIQRMRLASGKYLIDAMSERCRLRRAAEARRAASSGASAEM